MMVDQKIDYFDQLDYQTTAFLELKKIIQSGKIPNALLFHGNENTRRREAAFFFVKAVNCLAQDLDQNQLVCDHCRSCRKIDQNSHPDILSIDLIENKKIIPVSQIRNIRAAIAFRPNEAKMRMILIPDADQMNKQAQNAVLKLLEEPPENTFFVLMAKKMSKLLPTILSRCRKLRFAAMTEEQVRDGLMAIYKIDPQTATIASRTVHTDFKKALMMLNLDSEAPGDWKKRRRWLLSGLSMIIRSVPYTATHAALMFSQRISENPALIEDTFSILQTFFRDLVIFGIHPEKIVNLDFFDTFKDIRQITTLNIRRQWLRHFFRTEKLISSNSTLRLTIDRFFLKIVSTKEN